MRVHRRQDESIALFLRRFSKLLERSGKADAIKANSKRYGESREAAKRRKKRHLALQAARRAKKNAERAKLDERFAIRID